jgi:cytochrome c-type biogenesis protein CcmH/NrfG
MWQGMTQNWYPGALQDYLAAQQALPDEPIVALSLATAVLRASMCSKLEV